MSWQEVLSVAYEQLDEAVKYEDMELLRRAVRLEQTAFEIKAHIESREVSS